MIITRADMERALAVGLKYQAEPLRAPERLQRQVALIVQDHPWLLLAALTALDGVLANNEHVIEELRHVELEDPSEFLDSIRVAPPDEGGMLSDVARAMTADDEFKL